MNLTAFSRRPPGFPGLVLRFLVLWLLLTAPAGFAETNTAPVDPVLQRLKNLEESLEFVEQNQTKNLSDQMWFQRLADIALVDKIRYNGPPSRLTNNPTAQGAGNDIIVSAYTFLPKKSSGKIPLLVFVHGGVHGDSNPAEDAHIVRELVGQGYAVIAPDYRGSTGYGRDFWKLIDYGGLENEDVLAGRNWMIENGSNESRATNHLSPMSPPLAGKTASSSKKPAFRDLAI